MVTVKTSMGGFPGGVVLWEQSTVGGVGTSTRRLWERATTTGDCQAGRSLPHAPASVPGVVYSSTIVVATRHNQIGVVSPSHRISHRSPSSDAPQNRRLFRARCGLAGLPLLRFPHRRSRRSALPRPAWRRPSMRTLGGVRSSPLSVRRTIVRSSAQLWLSSGSSSGCGRGCVSRETSRQRNREHASARVARAMRPTHGSAGRLAPHNPGLGAVLGSPGRHQRAIIAR